jgi:hypothetical protein
MNPFMPIKKNLEELMLTEQVEGNNGANINTFQNFGPQWAVHGEIQRKQPTLS